MNLSRKLRSACGVVLPGKYLETSCPSTDGRRETGGPAFSHGLRPAEMLRARPEPAREQHKCRIRTTEFKSSSVPAEAASERATSLSEPAFLL